MSAQQSIISRPNEEPGKLFAFLSALAVRDRYVITPEAGATTVTIVIINKRQRPTFPVEAFLEALERGWIATDQGTNFTRITSAGRQAVRRHRAHLVAIGAAAGEAGHGPPKAPVATLNLKESPLSWLASRRDAAGRPMLNPWEVDAGERLRADLSFAHLTPRVTMGWSGLRMGGKRTTTFKAHELTDNIVAARTRVTSALRAVGPEFVDILIDVCGHLRGLEEIAQSENWPRRAVRLLLQRALSSLARHYGMAPETRIEEEIARRLRHWGSDDYRPSLNRWRPGGDHTD